MSNIHFRCIHPRVISLRRCASQFPQAKAHMCRPIVQNYNELVFCFQEPILFYKQACSCASWLKPPVKALFVSLVNLGFNAVEQSWQLKTFTNNFTLNVCWFHPVLQCPTQRWAFFSLTSFFCRQSFHRASEYIEWGQLSRRPLPEARTSTNVHKVASEIHKRKWHQRCSRGLAILLILQTRLNITSKT